MFPKLVKLDLSVPERRGAPDLFQSSYINSRRKRLFDILGVLAAVPVVFPLLTILAVMIRFSTGETPLFRQRRYGRGRRTFTILKLRTMRTASENEGFRQATQDDPRTTRFGAFLRRTSLDELPQFWNVLVGDMSLVGPRPHPVALDEHYLTRINCYHVRFEAKPGITGLAQTRGARGETVTRQSMVRRIRLDKVYVKSGTFWTDLSILWSTVAVVFSGHQAY